MKHQKLFNQLAIISYLLIILNGQMIGLPFFLWLIFTVFDFGSLDQLFAFLAMIGLTISVINGGKKRIIKILSLDFICFLLLVSLILGRLAAVPIELFNYGAFIIPTTSFVLFYIISLIFAFRQYSVIRKNINSEK